MCFFFNMEIDHFYGHNKVSSLKHSSIDEYNKKEWEIDCPKTAFISYM